MTTDHLLGIIIALLWAIILLDLRKRRDILEDPVSFEKRCRAIEGLLEAEKEALAAVQKAERIRRDTITAELVLQGRDARAYWAEVDRKVREMA